MIPPCVSGLSIFFRSTSTSLFIGGTLKKIKIGTFPEYLVQRSLKSRGTKDLFRRVKVPGIAPY
jgi:hypothetical protein